MIITHTQNANGERRIYLGGKSSVECWLEPGLDGKRWTFHWAAAVTGQPLDAEDARQSAIYALQQLAGELGVAPTEIAYVSFELIAALHVDDPFAGRRVALGRKSAIEKGFMATTPATLRGSTELQVVPRSPHQRNR